MKCECEHAAHFHDEGKKTPFGNPGHKYGQDFHKLESVKTPYGTFKVCVDCAVDCLNEYK